MRIRKQNKAKLGIIGKIKIGEKHPEKGYPMSLDYFRACADIKAIEGYYNEYYEKSSLLPVCFMTNDDNFNTDHRYEIRDKSGKLYAYGDGVDYYISKQEGFEVYTNEMIVEKNGSVDVFLGKVEQHLSTQKHTAKWVEVLTLRFILPKIPVLGVWELRTMASKSSIDQILSNYDLVKSINGGSIEGIPFILSVKKVKSQRVLDKARLYPVLSLDPILPNETQGNITNMPLIDSVINPKLIG